MKKEKRTVYVTDDGKVFQNENRAIEHEQETLRKERAVAKLKVYKVFHGFDDTEGRGYFATTVIVTDTSKPVILQWCINKFGNPLSSWYGNSYYEAWVLNEIKEFGVDWALKQEGKKNNIGGIPCKLVVISHEDFTEAGLPESEFPKFK